MNIIALIAHPDDLEIAAAGTICRLVGQDHKVLIVVVTDEAETEIKNTRQTEALSAAATIGVPANQVLFLGQADRFARNDMNSCRQLQSWMQLHKFKSDVVITHSKNDKHQDHRAVHELALSATKDSAGLYLFAAVINSLRKTDFLPTVFVETSRHWLTKQKALASYASQNLLGRIRIQDIDDHERRHAERLGESRVEAFEATYTDPIVASSLLQQFALPTPSIEALAFANQQSSGARLIHPAW